jgi:hypothetical protein
MRNIRSLVALTLSTLHWSLSKMSSWVEVKDDWVLLQDGSLSLHQDRQASKDSVFRAAVTPFGYIGRWVLDDAGLTYLDGEYGDAIYTELSEPVIQGWSQRAQAHLQRAMQFVDKDVKVLDVTVEYTSSTGMEIDGAKVTVRYSINNQVDTLQVQI